MSMIENAERKLIVVADDGGFHSAVDRGILEASEKELLTDVDVMVGKPCSTELVMTLQRDFPSVGIGVHVYLPGVPDNYFSAVMSYGCRLFPGKAFRKEVAEATNYQIKKFQDTFGAQPTHISTHQHLHLDLQDKTFPWFIDTILELTDGSLEKVIIRGLQTKPVRHTRFRSSLLGKTPLSPEAFKNLLETITVPNKEIVELVTHPALGMNEERLPAAYPIHLRELDLQALIKIITSGVIAQAGYEIVRFKDR